jgi:Resolvase, N terminal domain
LVGSPVFWREAGACILIAGRPMTKPATKTRRNGTVRCAIYTRKSSEEGLDQEFNSLQAQREACETFINSQRHEGWVCRRAVYDDGGFSGATMDRPALQQLLDDIAAGRVDTVVVYKIGRLPRQLREFRISAAAPKISVSGPRSVLPEPDPNSKTTVSLSRPHHRRCGTGIWPDRDITARRPDVAACCAVSADRVAPRPPPPTIICCRSRFQR